jgi:methylglyoxal synthase
LRLRISFGKHGVAVVARSPLNTTGARGRSTVRSQGNVVMDAPVALITPRKCIALVAHDNKKADLLEWAEYNRDLLAHHELLATGTTGLLLEDALQIPVVKLQSGPLGGDQQIGARIAEGTVDLVIFFWDPLQPQPHDPDVKALLRIAVVWNIPVACNRASADFMISSPLLASTYERQLPEYEAYQNRMGKVKVAADDVDPVTADSPG